MDRPAGEAAEQALAALAIRRDAAIIELTEPVRFAGQASGRVPVAPNPSMQP